MNDQQHPDPKRCGRLTDHPRHTWKGRGETSVVTSETDGEYGYKYLSHTWIGPWYVCSGHTVVEGGHW